MYECVLVRTCDASLCRLHSQPRYTQTGHDELAMVPQPLCISQLNASSGSRFLCLYVLIIINYLIYYTMIVFYMLHEWI